MYPAWEMYDEAEEDRTEHVAMLKARGKGAPKKAKSAAGELIVYRWMLVRMAMGWMLTVVMQIRTRRRRGGRLFMG